ncbi:MAG TPA: LysR family transcriptional regulator [Rhodoblastus sp.]|nr:LysR family transcriptional regulator [Rhodoblastus sp.]
MQNLRRFIALAQTGSFRAAAERLNCSQSAFSRSISELEAGLGVTLVDRIGHRNELTPAGRVMLDHARHVVADSDALTTAARSLVEGRGGRFRLGLSATPGAILGSSLLSWAATENSGTRISLIRTPTVQQLQALRARVLDLAVVDLLSVPPELDLNVEPLSPLPVGALCRSGHPLMSKKKVTVEDIRRFPVAAPPFNENAIRYIVQQFGSQAHPDELVTLHSQSIGELLEATCNTDAIFLGVIAAASSMIAAGRIGRLAVSTEGFLARYAIVKLVGRSHLAGLDRIEDHIRAMFRNALRLRP